MKILIVYCGHDDSSSANGVCVWNIAKELKRRGHEVLAIWQFTKDCFTEFEKNGVRCYGIRESWYYKLTQWQKKHNGFLARLFYKFVSFLRLFYVMPLYPNVSPWVALKCRFLANRIVKRNQIDRVLGIYMPYEAIETSLHLKRKYKNKLFVTNYHLDLIGSPINTNRFVRNYKLWKGNRAIKRELSTIDRMILPMSAKNICKDTKIRYVDFPLFVRHQQFEPCNFVFPDYSINITYVGSLDSSNRNPLYTLTLLKSCTERSGKKIVLHIWGNLSDVETRAIIDRYDFVVYHGTLENKYVQDILQRSDYLLNVSNAVTYNMIPSKIFQMFSIHKPIINIVRHKDDSALPYFMKYPNVINIEEYNHSDNSIHSMLGFLEGGNAKNITYNDDLYVESTPEYICNIIDDNN